MCKFIRFQREALFYDKISEKVKVKSLEIDSGRKYKIKPNFGVVSTSLGMSGTQRLGMKAMLGDSCTVVAL